MASDLFDGVYGCLVGGAIGDALGAPVESWQVADIRREHGKVDRLLARPATVDGDAGGQPGTITDDSALRHYLCLAILAKPGRITPDDYARTWLQVMNPDRFFPTERIVLQKLRLGMDPWETGRGQVTADDALMSMSPVGVVNAGDPAQAYQDGFVLAGMLQDGVDRDAAATAAAAVAVALLPGAAVTDVLEVMRHHASYEVRRLVTLAIHLAETSADTDQFADRCYAQLLDRSFPTPPGQEWDPQRSPAPTSRETLPAVVGLLSLVGDDPNSCLVEGASFGRDADTIASILGGIAGALHGATALRPEWIGRCEAVNSSFFAEAEPGNTEASFRTTATRLVDALRAQRTATEQRLATLSVLLEGST